MTVGFHWSRFGGLPPPGHAPQLPPAVNALAEAATAVAGLAIAMSVVRPSAILI